MTEEQEIYKQKCNAYGKTHHDGLNPEYIHLDIVRESEPKPEKSKCGVTDSLKKIALKSTEALRSKLNIKSLNILKLTKSVEKVHDTLTVKVNDHLKIKIFSKGKSYDITTKADEYITLKSHTGALPTHSKTNAKDTSMLYKAGTITKSIATTYNVTKYTPEVVKTDKIENVILNFLDGLYKQADRLINKTFQFVHNGIVYTVN